MAARRLQKGAVLAAHDLDATVAVQISDLRVIELVTVDLAEAR